MRHLSALAVASVLALAGLAPAAAAQAPDGVVPTSEEIDFLLGLKRQEGGLAQIARAVSDPSSPYYRRYLGVREISRRFGANPVTKRTVKRYFARRGARASVDPSGAFATVSVAPTDVPALFGVSAHSAAASESGPPVPAALRGAVTGIAVPATGPPKRPAAATPGFDQLRTGTPKGCAAGRDATIAPTLPSRAFTPNQIAEAHGLGPLHRRGLLGQGRRIALLEYAGGFDPNDLRVFADCFGLPKPKLTVRGISGNRVPMPASERDSDEVTLDIEVLMGMAPRAAIDVYQGNDVNSYGEGFAAALRPRKGQQLPDAISLSYGTCELLLTDESARTQRRLDRYMTHVAAAAGVPILVSSDDQGSSACSPFGIKRALTSYPATAQYVTAVGGVSFTLRPDNSIRQQRVWNDELIGPDPHGGGGGTSGLIARPWYQRAAGIERGKGRELPDLAFYADPIPGWAIYCTAQPSCGGRGWLAVGGTSAATPLFAAGIALANQDAARHGQPPIGFANPLLYELARSKRSPFRDVTIGDNDVFDVGCCRAHRGFDRASGWGTLHLARFARAARAAYRAR